MQITPEVLKALQTTLNTSFDTGYAEASPWSTNVAMTVTSSTKIATYAWMQRIPQMRKWVGPRVIENLKSNVYQLLNEDYELTIGVGQNEFEDENLGIYSNLFEEMGRSARKWPDDIIKIALQAGDTTDSYDGQPFFSVDHPIDPAKPTGQDNLFTGTALSAANYETGRAAMKCLTGEDGQGLGMSPNLLIVPPQLEGTARTILKADLISGGNTNVFANSAQLLVVDELCDEPTVWYLMDTSRAIKPLLFQQRKAPRFIAKTDPSDDRVFYDKEFVWGVDSRGAAGYSLWFMASRFVA